MSWFHWICTSWNTSRTWHNIWLNIWNTFFWRWCLVLTAVRGSAVDSGTVLQTGRSRLRIPMGTLRFFIDLILPALGLTQPLTEVCTRDLPWVCKGCRCLGLTTLPFSYSECQKFWELQPPAALRAYPGLYRDRFTLPGFDVVAQGYISCIWCSVRFQLAYFLSCSCSVWCSLLCLWSLFNCSVNGYYVADLFWKKEVWRQVTCLNFNTCDESSMQI